MSGLARREVLGLSLATVLASFCGPLEAARRGQRAMLLLQRPADLDRAAFAALVLAELRADRLTNSRDIVFGTVIDDPGKPAGNSALSPVDIIIAATGSARQRNALLTRAASLARAAQLLLVTTETFVEPSDRSLRVTTLLRRRADTTHDAFVDHALRVHGPLSRDVRGLDGYAMSGVTGSDVRGDHSALAALGEIDVVGEGWIGAGAPIPDSPARAAWLADGKANFGNIIRIVTRDQPVRG